METYALIRKMDKAGRVVLPLELRRDLHLEKGGEVEFETVGEPAALIVRPIAQAGRAGVRLDELGRVMIPPSLRARLKLMENTSLRIAWSPEERTAKLAPVTPSCCICGCADGLYPVKQAYICRECRDELIRADS